MKFKRSMNVAITCVLSITLACSSIFVPKSSNSGSLAFGDEQTVSNYKEAKAYLASVRSEYKALMSQATAIYNRIEDITSKAFDAQNKMTEKQLQLNDVAKYEYMNSVQFSILTSIMEAESMDDFFKNLDYANSVMDYQYRLAKEQGERKAEFDSILENLNTENASQNELLSQASEKLNNASDVLNSIRSKLTPEELKELEGEVEDIGGGGGGGDTPTPGPTPPGPTPPGPTPGPSWSTGIASAYGGSSDPHTPNPGRTATGEICDDWSTGVAIPMAWPNYRSYFHHTVQIS